jgi:hypothetical protein
MYPGKRHVVSGPPEAAKTLLAYATALDEVRKGSAVVVLDFEMGPWDARDRLRDLGAGADDFANVVYVEPETPPGNADLDALIAYAPSLVVIDSSAGAYALLGLDDNKRADAEAFAATFVAPFWRAGVAVIVLDHVTKDAKARGMFAIGSERKVGGADVHLSLDPRVPLTRGGRGVYLVRVLKDRGGHLPRPTAGEIVLRSDPETHAIETAFTPADATADEPRWRPTGLMEKVSRFLESGTSREAGCTGKNEVVRNVLGRDRYIRLALDALVAEGYVEETAGPNRSKRVRSLKPYREAGASGYIPGTSRPHPTTPSPVHPGRRGSIPPAAPGDAPPEGDQAAALPPVDDRFEGSADAARDSEGDAT